MPLLFQNVHSIRIVWLTENTAYRECNVFFNHGCLLLWVEQVDRNCNHDDFFSSSAFFPKAPSSLYKYLDHNSSPMAARHISCLTQLVYLSLLTLAGTWVEMWWHWAYLAEQNHLPLPGRTATWKVPAERRQLLTVLLHPGDAGCNTGCVIISKKLRKGKEFYFSWQFFYFYLHSLFLVQFAL